MNKILSVLAAVAFACVSAGAFAADDAYKTAKKTADDTYKADKKACKPMKGAEEKACMKEAKAKHASAMADAKAMKKGDKASTGKSGGASSSPAPALAK